MKQKQSLIIGVVAILLIVVALFPKGGGRQVAHERIGGTDGVLKSGACKADLKQYAVNFYMENSASMDGYVNGGTFFKDVLGRMMVSAKGLCRSADFSFVNDAVYKVDENPVSFIQNMDAGKMNVGNIGSTNINLIFKNLLKSTRKNQIAVLFSDCIYSVKNVTGELDNAKNATTDAFLDAIKANPELATVVLQFKSQFSGTYYDRNDKPLPCNGMRPYYVVMMGDKAALKTLCDNIKLAEMPGLLNRCYFSPDSWTLGEATACTVISDYTNARRIKTAKNALDIDEIKLDREALKLRFAVGVDMGQLFVDDAYVADVANYEVSPSDYRVLQVVPASDAAKSDFAVPASKPYAVQMEVPVGRFASEVTVSLRNRIPAWVKKANVRDDAGFVPQPTQSFAIEQMVEGIFNAYDISDKRIFKLELNIKKYKR